MGVEVENLVETRCSPGVVVVLVRWKINGNHVPQNQRAMYSGMGDGNHELGRDVSRNDTTIRLSNQVSLLQHNLVSDNQNV